MEEFSEFKFLFRWKQISNNSLISMSTLQTLIRYLIAPLFSDDIR